MSNLWKFSRRLCRFSLRNLLLAASLAVVGVIIVGRPIREYYIDINVKKHIASLGGQVTEQPIARGLLVRWMPETAQRVVRVNLGNRHLKPGDLEPLTQLPELTSLYLHYSDVDDAGIKNLHYCRKLQTLDLDGTQITDRGLEDVGKISSLKWLGLRKTRISDAGIRHLRSLTNLEDVMVWSTKVTESGADSLRAAQPHVTVSRFPLRR